MAFRGLWLLFCLVLPGVPAQGFAAGKPNVVLVTMESARADRVGFLGGKAATPNLDGLAKQALLFEQAYAQEPATVSSEATILTGSYPQTHKMTELAERLPANVPLLADILHARGYHTAAFVGTIELDPRAGDGPGFERGFERYDAGFARPAKGRDSSQTGRRGGAEVVAKAAAWLATAQGPFFLWVQLSDADVAPAAYNAGLAAADSAIGKLVAALQAKKIFEGTVIAVAGDHGQGLGAHDEDTHGIFLYDETVHVPLLLKLAGGAAGQRVKAKASLVSVAPSLLEAAGIPVPSQMQGQSLLKLARGAAPDQPVYARNDFAPQAFGFSVIESWRAGKYLYVRAPRPELYDLSADAGAQRNAAASSKATLDTMAGQLSGFSAHFGAAGTSNAGLTSAEMQKLASLGYVGLQKQSASSAVTGTDAKDEAGIANKVLNAKAFNEDGKPEKAIGTLQPVIDAAARMYLAQFEMGEAYFEQQKFAKAIEYLHKAIELQPNAVWAHYEMGASLMKTGDYKTAAVHLEIASSRREQFADARNLLAEAYEHLGRKEEAKKLRAKTPARP